MPYPLPIPLADCKTRNAQIIRDVVNNKGAEPRVSEEGYTQCEVDENRGI